MICGDLTLTATIVDRHLPTHHSNQFRPIHSAHFTLHTPKTGYQAHQKHPHTTRPSITLCSRAEQATRLRSNSTIACPRPRIRVQKECNSICPIQLQHYPHLPSVSTFSCASAGARHSTVELADVPIAPAIDKEYTMQSTSGSTSERGQVTKAVAHCVYPHHDTPASSAP